MAQENRLEGKLDGRRVFIDVQNVHCFAAAKVPMLRQSHAMQRRTELRRGVLESGKKSCCPSAAA